MSTPDDNSRLNDLLYSGSLSTAFPFEALPDGMDAAINRPLARDYVLPSGSAHPHGVDNDTTIEEQEHFASGPPVGKDDPNRRILVAPTPIPVVDVNVPLRSVLRNNLMRTVFGYDLAFTGQTIGVPNPNVLGVAQVFGYDDTRMEGRVWASANSIGAATGAYYAFALSTDATFSPGAWVPVVAGMTIVHNGKNALYATPLPILAATVAGNNNTLVLCASQLLVQMVNQVL